MRSLMLATVAVLAMTALPALARAQYGIDPATGARPGHEPGVGVSLPLSNQASNIEPGDTRSIVAPTLPTPSVGPGATPRDYLAVARAALVSGKTGEAQQALEMAETRALDRPVVPSQTSVPSGDPLIARIGEARRALGRGDRGQAIAMIDRALSN